MDYNPTRTTNITEYHLIIHAKVKDIPNFVFNPGLKSLNAEKIKTVTDTINSLDKVNHNEYLAISKNNIGILYAFINNHTKSLEYFKISLENEFNEEVLLNYMNSLEFSLKQSEAFSLGFKFLKLHPNNSKILNKLYSLAYRYPSNCYIEKLSNFNLIKHNEILKKFKVRTDLLDKYNVDQNMYSFILNIANSEIAKIHNGELTIESIEYSNVSIDTQISVSHLSIVELVYLNSAFEESVKNQIDRGIISFASYFDLTSKVNIFFRVLETYERDFA